MDLLGSFVAGILQARILEWVAILFSRGSSQPKDQTQVSCIASGFLTIWAIREADRQEVDLGFVSELFLWWDVKNLSSIKSWDQVCDLS